MLNVYFVYDANGIITTAKTSYPVDSDLFNGAQILVVDPTVANAQQALSAPSNFMVQNGQILPAATIRIDRTHTIESSWEVYTLTLSTSDKLAHDVTLSFLGVAETINIPAESTTYQIAIHKSVANYTIEVTAQGAGLVTAQVPIGGSNPSSTPLQTYKDADGLLHIAPTQKVVLVSYYGSMINPAHILPDLSTSDGMLMQAVFGIILPALTGGTTPLVTLDSNQQNAVADIQANVLSNIVTSLENAVPVPDEGQQQMFDIHYKNYRDDLTIAKQAFDQYVCDVQTIPNLV